MELLTELFGKFEGYKSERRSAGSIYRLMGLTADARELAVRLESEVLEVVKHEALLDADTDVDFGEMSERTLALELTEPAGGDEAMAGQTRLANEALGALSGVLAEIADQLERHHSDEEYARLYEQEKRRYLSSGSAQRARRTFGEWKEHVCFGKPSLEDIEDYRLEKVVHLFEKGVFSAKVEHIQRAKRYAGELDFEQLDDEHRLRRVIYKHYAALRKLADWHDGYLLVNPARAGQHFFASRHDEKAKSNRTVFLKYMHKIDLVQQERRQLIAALAEAAQRPAEPREELNYFAPAKHLKILLSGEWFGMLTTDDRRFDREWADGLVDGLMASEWGGQIARDWAVKDKRLMVKCMVIGMLKDAGVVRGSYNSIAKLLEMDGENPATLAKYMGLGKKQGFAEWIEEYIKGSAPAAISD